MSKNYLNEAFNKLNELDEDIFPLNDKGIEELKAFKSGDFEDELEVIDTTTEEAKDLQDTYINKVILDCNVCHSKSFKDPSEVIIDEETGNANIDEECTVCYSTDGYKICGQVEEYNQNSDDEEEFEKEEIKEKEIEDKEDSKDEFEIELKDENIDESKKSKKNCKFRKNRKLNESTHEIWNSAIDVDDWVEGYKETFNLKDQDEVSEDEVFDWAIDLNNEYLDDERSNLDKNVGSPIIAFGDLGLWDGHKQGYKVINSGNLKDCLYDNNCDSCHWFVEDGEFKFSGGHHDGHNYYTYRKLKADKSLEDFEDAYAEGNIDINEWTDKLGKDVAEVYGWSVSESTNNLLNESNNDKDVMNLNKYYKDHGLTKHGNPDDLFTRVYDDIFYSSGKIRSEYSDVRSNYTDYVDMSKIYGGASIGVIIRSDDTKELIKKIAKDKNLEYRFDEIGGNLIGTIIIPEGTYKAEIEDIQEENTCNTKNENCDKKVNEDVEKVEVKTDTQEVEVKEEEGKLTIDLSPIDNKEVLAPISDEVKAEIDLKSEIKDEEEIEKEEIEDKPEEETIDLDIEDFDEESFDKLGESYLKKVYDNVKGYKTTNIKNSNKSLIIEGLITFNSGKTKKTKYRFSPNTATKNNKLKFVGENLQITNGKKAFTITGILDGKKFLTESFNYNYRQKDPSSNKRVRVYGTIKK